MLVIEPDRLEARHVAVSPIYRELVAQEGVAAFAQTKASLLTRALNSRSAVRWTAAPVEVADLGWKRLAGCDLILSCTDNALARVETAFTARSLRVPMLDAGILGGDDSHGTARGRVAWFAPRPAAACYLCGFGEARRAEVLSFALASSLGCRPPEGVAPMGALPEVPRILQATAAQLVCLVQAFASARQNARSQRSSWAATVTATGETSQSPQHRLVKRGDCPWHEASQATLVALAFNRPLAHLWHFSPDRGGDWRLEFAWPIVLSARCRVCGSPQQIAQRLAALRRRGVCALCGAVDQLDPLHCLSRVAPHDPEAACTPRQLGLPEQHLYQLRRAFPSSMAAQETQ